MRLHQFLAFSAFAWLCLCPIATAQKVHPSSSANPDLHIAFVTNGLADFWKLAIRGAQQAAKENGVKLTVRQPVAGPPDQVRILNDLLGQKINGIGVSVIDPKSQMALLKRITKESILVLHDVDAPDSGRACFVGVDNYEMGRLCGRLVKEAVPKGGEVAPFVGRIDVTAARQRWQGMVDELLDRKTKQKQKDDPMKPVNGKNYTVLPIQVDDFDQGKAVKRSTETLTKYPNVKCMVGLFSYNIPACLQAVKSARKLGHVKLVGFDEMKPTLRGIQEGHVHGTVAQDPFKMGYETVRALVSASTQSDPKIPPSGVIKIKPLVIRRNNVVAFQKQMQKVLNTGKRIAP